jgi:predicted 2-oxoglutarate/Fe(II)-dependent dioxygenase YbiX
MKFDDNGYIRDRPVKPNRWQDIMPEMPVGRFITNHALPPGMLMIQNFLDPAWCEQIIRECEAEHIQQRNATVNEFTGASQEDVASDLRRTEIIDVRLLKTQIVEFMKHTFNDVIAPYYSARIEWFELPQILRYRPGGEYKRHADADNWLPSERKWQRVLDRDLSVLIYLNDDYEGGEIVFPNFDVGLKPQRGLLAAFPSDCRYMHAAQTVKSGTRYALVSWAACVGAPRIMNEPIPDIVRM